MTLPELTCRELVERVTDYLEDVMPAEDRERFETHLGECPYCELYLEQIRTTIQAAGGLHEPALSKTSLQGLLRVFATWKAGR